MQPDEESPDPGCARAGTAVAERRRELDISQRSLAADGIVNAGALIAFEKGRSWPRAATREKLEKALQWPPGTIGRIRRGGDAPALPAEDATTGVVYAPLIAQAVEVALGAIQARVQTLDSLPVERKRTEITDILGELRRLEALAAEGVRSAKGSPDVVLILSRVRRTYRELLPRAAQLPNPTRGLRLSAARHQAELTAEEVADAAGITIEMLTAAEADEPVPDPVKAAIEALLSWLAVR